MDLDRYYELRNTLQQWKGRLAESIRRRIEDAAHRLARLQEAYAHEGVDEPFTTWLDRWCRQAAIQFILRLLFLRVLEDRDLLGATRIRNTDGQRMWDQLTRNLGAAHYVQWCFWDAAHLLPDLFGPTDYDLVLPDDEPVQRFLDDVWRRPDPDRGGHWLRFDFRPDPARADEGFQTRFIGDLYQELDAEIRDRYALLQTPHFISQFILEHTLLKRFEEKDFREVTLLDPTAGSGHFLVDAFWMFVERYEAEELSGEHATRNTQHVSRFTSHASLSAAQRAKIARTVVEQHLFGCDINPYATALARFRLLLAACDYAHPTSLRDFRDLHFNLVTIDSLIPYEKLMVASLQDGNATGQVLGQPEAIKRALPVLRNRYDVVVGNPPYITEKSKVKRDFYREHYIAAYRKFSLAAPFIERFLHLAVVGGQVGLITSNAFANRLFGKKLIEEVLSKYDLGAVVDLSGAYIPGHGTPTLLLFACNQPPSDKTVLLFSNMKGEPGTPGDPTRGQVWQSVLRGYTEGDGYRSEFIDVAARPRELLKCHPWQFGGPATRLLERVTAKAACPLEHLLETSVGFSVIISLDDVYLHPADSLRRFGIRSGHFRPILAGVDIRDWKALATTQAIYPYHDDFSLVKFEDDSPERGFLDLYQTHLEQRPTFGGSTFKIDGRPWYEYHQFPISKASIPRTIAFAEIATHNHFVYHPQGRIYARTAPVIKLKDQENPAHLCLTALLNTAFVCFFLKQVCYNKGTGDDPVRDRYVYAGNYLAMTPIPHNYGTDTPTRSCMLALAKETTSLTNQFSGLTMRKLFERDGEAYHVWNAQLDGYIPRHPDVPEFSASTHELRNSRDKLIELREDIRARMIFLQEEMDWVAYDMYGLLKSKPPLAEDYLSRAEYEAARLELGQRPFEVAGKGYEGDWPEGYQPQPVPESLRPLTEARIAIIQSNPDVALLEDPLYKRRWIPPDYDAEFREAAEWWLAEKLEWALEQHGHPISLRQWARVLGRDERVNAALEVLTGTPMFDLEQELLQIIRANSAPNRPEHYLKPAGLRKLYATRTPRPAEGAAPVVPRFNRKDFADATAWKLRGKLNIPRERFIYYAEFDHTGRVDAAPDSGGPWFGWAGWDAAQRADALAFLLDRANRAGWELRWRQCGLRAALRDLLPQLGDLPAADRDEFEAIAGTCGIGLGTSCYCQAYRDGVARGEPGVPGVGDDVLGVKPLAVARRQPGRRRKKDGTEGQQLTLEFGEFGVE